MTGKGYTLMDRGIGITCNMGTLADGADDSFYYVSSLDPDVQSSINKILVIEKNLEDAMNAPHVKGEFHPAVEADCEHGATKAYYDCTDCGLKLDENGKVIRKVSVGSAHGHSPAYATSGSSFVAACERCGATIGRLSVDIKAPAAVNSPATAVLGTDGERAAWTSKGLSVPSAVFSYYTEAGQALASAPKEDGSYVVKASMKAGDETLVIEKPFSLKSGEVIFGEVVEGDDVDEEGGCHDRTDLFEFAYNEDGDGYNGPEIWSNGKDYKAPGSSVITDYNLSNALALEKLQAAEGEDFKAGTAISSSIGTDSLIKVFITSREIKNLNDVIELKGSSYKVIKDNKTNLANGKYTVKTGDIVIKATPKSVKESAIRVWVVEIKKKADGNPESIVSYASYILKVKVAPAKVAVYKAEDYAKGDTGRVNKIYLNVGESVDMLALYTPKKVGKVISEIGSDTHLVVIPSKEADLNYIQVGDINDNVTKITALALQDGKRAIARLKFNNWEGRKKVNLTVIVMNSALDVFLPDEELAKLKVAADDIVDQKAKITISPNAKTFLKDADPMTATTDTFSVFVTNSTKSGEGYTLKGRQIILSGKNTKISAAYDSKNGTISVSVNKEAYGESGKLVVVAKHVDGSATVYELGDIVVGEKSDDAEDDAEDDNSEE